MLLQNCVFTSFGGLGEISFIGSATQSNSSDFKYSFSSSAVAGAASGHLAILAVANDFTVSAAPEVANGWTTIFNDTAFDGTSAAGLFTKRLTSSDVTALAQITSLHAAAMIVVSGASYATHSNSAANTKTPPAISMNGGDMSVVIGFYQDDETNNLNVPSGYSHETEAASVNPGSGASGICIGTKLITASGTETPAAFGGSVAAGDMMRATTIRLSPF